VAALAAVAATASVAAWGSFLFPERWPRWLVAATLLPAIWAFAEPAQERGRDPSVGRPI
jgi:hypothetical protein